MTFLPAVIEYITAGFLLGVKSKGAMMRKQRSIGVTVFSWIWLIIAVIYIILTLTSLAVLTMPPEYKIAALKNPDIQQLGINSTAGLDRHQKSTIMYSLSLGIIILLVTIGLFRLKKGSELGIILVASLDLVYEIVKISSSNKIRINVYSFFSVLLCILTIYFFTRPEVKEQFKQ